MAQSFQRFDAADELYRVYQGRWQARSPFHLVTVSRILNYKKMGRAQPFGIAFWADRWG